VVEPWQSGRLGEHQKEQEPQTHECRPRQSASIHSPLSPSPLSNTSTTNTPWLLHPSMRFKSTQLQLESPTTVHLLVAVRVIPGSLTLSRTLQPISYVVSEPGLPNTVTHPPAHRLCCK
jgi:hypothetical protein